MKMLYSDGSVDKAFYVQQNGYYKLTADLNTLTVTLERIKDWQE